jgi:hypothetical protein
MDYSSRGHSSRSSRTPDLRFRDQEHQERPRPIIRLPRPVDGSTARLPRHVIIQEPLPDHLNETQNPHPSGESVTTLPRYPSPPPSYRSRAPSPPPAYRP